MSGFHDVRFPLALALGARGGPERRTEIVTLGSGREARNTPWAYSRRRWDAGVGVRTLDDLHTLLTFFEARRGQLYGFRWRDPADWKSCPPSQEPTATDQTLGVGDGVQTQFPLIKRYADAAHGVERPIQKPVSGSVITALNGVAQDQGWSVDEVTGLVTFDVAPAQDVAVTAGFAFDCPVRFDTARIEVDVEAFDAGSAPLVPVVELIL